jgi:hypothetical protein
VVHILSLTIQGEGTTPISPGSETSPQIKGEFHKLRIIILQDFLLHIKIMDAQLSQRHLLIKPSSTQSLEETMREFMKMTGQSISDIRNSTMVNTQAISKLEIQVGQLANHLVERDKGKLPSQPVNNSKACTIKNSSAQEHAHVIVTLRSGKRLNNQVAELETNDEAVPTTELARQEETRSDNKEEIDVVPSTVTPIEKDLPRSFVPKAPCPERLRASKKNAQFAEILEVFKQVQINILFLDAI